VEARNDSTREAGLFEVARIERGSPGPAALAFAVEAGGPCDHLRKDGHLVADFARIADAQAAPTGLLHGRDQRRGAAVDVVMRVDPLKAYFGPADPQGRRGWNEREQLPSGHISAFTCRKQHINRVKRQSTRALPQNQGSGPKEREMNRIDLAGRRAVVTGGGQGIGRAVA